MSGESLLELAVFHAPNFEGLVPRPSEELPLIRRVELEAGDKVAAIFSHVSFSTPRKGVSVLSPPPEPR